MEEEIKKEEETKEEIKQEVKEPERPLDKMTAIELREIAMGIEGVTGAHAMKKEELLKIIKEARGIKDEGPARKKAEVKKEISAAQIKQKIALLRKAKEAALTSRDRRKVDVFRRRINRLKKLSRRAA